MYRLLVIDDEELVRRGIVARVLRVAPDTQVREASCAREALECLRAFRPHIVLTDIQMPETDGLSFIEQALAIAPDTQFAILSGYAEFSYAKRALQLGVSEYLLKPITNEALSAALTKMERHFDANASISSRLSERDKLQSELSHLSDSQAFLRLINMRGSETPEACRQLQTLLLHQEEGKWALALLLASGASEENHLQSLLEPLLPRDGSISLFPNLLSDDRLYAVIRVSGRADALSASRRLESLIAALAAKGVTLTAGVSAPLDIIDFEAQQEAAFALQRRLISGPGRVYLLGSPSTPERDARLTDDIETLWRLMTACDASGAEAALRALFDPARVDNAPARYVYAVWMRVMSLIMRLSPGTGGESAPVPWPDMLDRFRDREEFLDYILSLALAAMGAQNESEGRGDARIPMAVQYIRTHFQEPLTLNDLSYQYALSPNYFSLLFKKETGMGVVNFITHIRMETARRLLSQTHVGVSEIARRVGYDDAQYFFRVFKKNTGVTPLQYRRESENGEG